jgi:hypothetical protein
VLEHEGATPPTLDRVASASFDRDAGTAAIRQLDDPRAWPGAAASLVAETGFRLIEAHPAAATAGLPGGSLESHLVVALRDQPTLRHFDPEAITFYSPSDAGAGLRSVGRLEPGADTRHVVSWGHLQVVDRIPVENRFLTFGGELRLHAIDASLTVAHLRSPVPMVRWGGHSQGTDGLAEAIGAFFGRLIVPVDFVPGAARRIGAFEPEVVFTAFVGDAVRRLDAAARRRTDESSELDRWLRAAWVWLRPATAWRAEAESLLSDLPG